MLAFSLDNLLFLLLIAVAALFQLLSKTINKSGKSDSNETPSPLGPQTPRPIQRPPRESDADRIRKFLEALGQPTSSTPPPPVPPRADLPPRPMAPVQPPPVLTPMWRFPREKQGKRDVTQEESDQPEQPRRVRQLVPPPVPAPVIPAFEVHESSPLETQQAPNIEAPVEVYAVPSETIAKRANFRMDIGTLLASKSSLREVILLREILGPPRGLQSLDATL